MIAMWQLNNPEDRQKVEERLRRLRLNPLELALPGNEMAAKESAVRAVIADVAQRGDAAIVDSARKFDDPDFSAEQICVAPEELSAAAARVPADLLAALRHAIAQVREYQQHIMPKDPADLVRGGARFGMRFTPLDSAGCYFPGGKAAYPSSLIHLAVPAIVAGVKRVVVVTPASKYGKSDVVLAACHELKLEHVYRAGGAAAIAALAFGTATIPAVDKIVGPGNDYVQLAKRAVAGGVGVDGYLGPSEVLVIADETANAKFVAADLIAQAEHDPGSCFLLTTSNDVAEMVRQEIISQLNQRQRRTAIERSLAIDSAIIVGESMDDLIDLANRFAAEHINLQTGASGAALKRLVHGGAIFIGGWSPVAAGDYVAGPSHCLPTNTTARFSSGVSVYEFLKRTSLVRYDQESIAKDVPAVERLANEEHLDAHAASAAIRVAK
jgi:histidinol dehydrogenase